MLYKSFLGISKPENPPKYKLHTPRIEKRKSKFALQFGRTLNEIDTQTVLLRKNRKTRNYLKNKHLLNQPPYTNVADMQLNTY